jgi:hypothetical protein
MNVKQIEPISVWTAQGDKSLTYLALANFFDYHFDDGGGKITYKLIAMEGDPETAVEYIVSNLDIPSNIIQQWGASDDIIWEYVSNKLNLVII